jgi:hypothetical protein
MRSDKELWHSLPMRGPRAARCRCLLISPGVSVSGSNASGWDKEIQMRAEFARKRGQK